MEIDKKTEDQTKELVNETESSIIALKVTNSKELEVAKDLLSKVTESKRRLTETERSFLDPLNRSRNNIIAFFKPFKAKLSDLEIKIKNEMSGYIELLNKKEEAKKKEVEKKIAEGKLDMDMGIKEIQKIEIRREDVNYRINRKVEIEDVSKLPRKYLMPNEVLIRKDALAGVKIPGVKVVETKTIISK